MLTPPSRTNWGLPPAGLQVELREHVGDVMQLVLSHHPVTQRPNVRVGYAPRMRKDGWHVRQGLLAMHGLSERHIELIQSLLEELYDADKG